MKKIYLLTDELDLAYFKKSLHDVAELRLVPVTSEQDILTACADAEILVSLYVPITRRVMEGLPQLEYVALTSIGANTVDLEAARELGIRVSNNPFYCVEDVADHVSAMILSLCRKLFYYDRQVKQGVWNYAELPYPMIRLSDQTLGLVGYGQIARRVHQRMKAFGFQVIAYDPFIDAERMQAEGAQKVSLDELCERADVISLHLPLNDSTRNLFDESRLATLKPGCIFINASRGEIMDEKAVFKALTENRLQAAGLDVLASESPDPEDLKALTMDNLLITPHAAFYSEGAMRQADEDVVRFIRAFIAQDYEHIPLVVR